jgi:hypothetical protein
VLPNVATTCGAPALIPNNAAAKPARSPRLRDTNVHPVS